VPSVPEIPDLDEVNLPTLPGPTALVCLVIPSQIPLGLGRLPILENFHPERACEN
jgi:hypothetical protein